MVKCKRINSVLWEIGIVLFIALGASSAATINFPKAGCSFNLETDSPKYPPHLIDGDNRIILPTIDASKARFINLIEGQKVEVACIGRTATSNNLPVTGQQLNEATCVSNKLRLTRSGIDYAYGELGCVSQNKEVLIEDGTTCANGPGTVIRIGWLAFGDDPSKFIPLWDACHDKVLALNYVSTHWIVGASADADDKANSGPTFSQGGYYPGLSVDNLYRQDTQTQTIAGIVGSDSLAAYYVNTSKSFYLARGHMAPDGDFIDAASQDASYYFMNAAPQWQSFNNGNWKALETAVRNLAINRRIDFTIYTGTYGVVTLADINGVQQPIYLTFDENKNGLIPAPKYFWKVVHHPASNTATAVIGINNPHIGVVQPTDIFCPDVCSEVPWVTWVRSDIPKGYTFCCTVAELHKAIGFSPDLDLPLFK